MEEAWWSGIVEPSAEWHALQHAGAAAAVAYRVRVLCQPNYYNTTCTTFCRPRDDKFGHYSCTSEGDKRCLPGWQGDNCEKRESLSVSHSFMTVRHLLTLFYLQLCARKAATPHTAAATAPETASEYPPTVCMYAGTRPQQCWLTGRLVTVAGRAGAASCAPSASRTRAASTATATAPPGTAPATPTGAGSCVTKVGGLQSPECGGLINTMLTNVMLQLDYIHTVAM